MKTRFDSLDQSSITALARQIAKSTCKLYVYQSDRPSVPQSHGSSVLFEFDNSGYCISNAHVLSDKYFGQVFALNGANKSMTIGGHFVSTSMPPSGKREDDIFDISIIKLTDLAVTWLKESGYIFLDIKKIKSGVILSKTDSLLIVGYPASKTKTNVQKRSLNTSPFYLVTTTSVNAFRHSNFSDEYHIAVNYRRNKIIKPQSKGFESGPQPYGMSGGGVWLLEKNNQGTFDVYLISIMFEYLKEKSAIVSTRIDLFLDIIKQKLDPNIPTNGIGISIL